MASNDDEIVKNGVSNGDTDQNDATDGNNAAGETKKNKKGKNKKSKDTSSGGSGGQQLSADQQENLRKAMEMLNMQQAGPAKNEEEAAKKNYQFWSTQPVPAIDEVIHN